MLGAIDNRAVNTRLAVLLLAVPMGGGLALGAGCGDDDYPIGPGDDSPDADPTQPDADPSGPDARPDADPSAPDARVDAAGDSRGPTIEVIAPIAGTLIQGTVTFMARVTDPDGVDPTSVSVTIGGDGEVDLSPMGTDTWFGSYDTFALAGLVFPTVVFRAADLVGDASQVGFQVALDNEGPLAALNPPKVREAQLSSDGALECSVSFDPVGPDAPDDGESVAQLIELRARVQDIGNTGTATSTVYIPHAGVDPASVQLYVLDDTTRPLIVDGDGDGVCDRINPEIVPSIFPMTSSEAAVVDLIPLDPSGSSYFSSTVGGTDPFAGTNAAAGCVAGGDSEPPAQLCLAADGVQRVAAAPFTGAPMIYAPGPVTTFGCMGLAFDAVASNISDGWACAAVATRDLVGNARVSPVLRICIDADGDSAECTDWGTIAVPAVRPNCTGTYDPVSGDVSTTPCSAPASFLDNGLSGDYELLRLGD